MKKCGTPTHGALFSCRAERTYEAALVEFLRKQSAPTKIAALGSSVKKPSDKIKVQKFVEARPKLFKLDIKNQTVELAKK